MIRLFELHNENNNNFIRRNTHNKHSFPFTRAIYIDH